MDPSPLDRLRADHQEVLKRLGGLDARLETLPDAPDAEARRAVDETIAFIEDEVWRHFRAEEEALFPLLRGLFPAENAPVAGGPVFVLTEEHGVLRKLVARARAEADRWEAGEPGAADALRLSGRQMVRAFQKHIYKEDNIVFRMADTFLPADARTALNDAFARLLAH